MLYCCCMLLVRNVAAAVMLFDLQLVDVFSGDRTIYYGCDDDNVGILPVADADLCWF